MSVIKNTQECFVQLWLRLERARHLLKEEHRRFCIRNVLKLWLGNEATDDIIWEVCRQAMLSLDTDEGEPVYGNDELPPPKLYPRKHRELLRALVAVMLDIGIRKVHLHDLDAAYSIAFPNSTPININKKRATKSRKRTSEKRENVKKKK